MNEGFTEWSDLQTESVIGTLLRVGVVMAATVVACVGSESLGG